MDSTLFLRRFFLHFFPGFSAMLFVLMSCQTRSEFKNDAPSAGQYALEGHDAEENATEPIQKQNQGQDTTVYGQPQIQGAYLSAPDEAHNVLWGNKGDKPVKAAESNVVLLTFIIETDSTASSVKVLKGINAAVDSIAVQSVKKATWKPGYVMDRPVRSRFAFPVVF